MAANESENMLEVVLDTASFVFVIKVISGIAINFVARVILWIMYAGRFCLCRNHTILSQNVGFQKQISDVRQPPCVPLLVLSFLHGFLFFFPTRNYIRRVFDGYRSGKNFVVSSFCLES